MRLQHVFGFQEDNVKNISSYFMCMLDSRASRMGPFISLRTLHGDYIGGPRANFKKWYFACEMDLDDLPRRYIKTKTSADKEADTFKYAQSQWAAKMARLSPSDQVTHVALYLLCWGEANNLRFMPECLCFIFKCCVDYYYSLSEHNAAKGTKLSFLDHAITPLYLTLREQLYTKDLGISKRVDKDHAAIIGYDDMNQLFWHRSGLQRISLPNKILLMDLSKEERYSALVDVNWKSTFTKTYKESRTWLHILVNFNRVSVIHLCMFWYYTSIHAYPLYSSSTDISFDAKPSIQVSLSIMSLAASFACLICLISTCLEAYFLPRRWPGAHPVLRRFSLLLVLFFLSFLPTILIFHLKLHLPNDLRGVGVAVCQLIFSFVVVIYLAVVPPLSVFGSKLKGRNEFSSRYFTSNFYDLTGIEKLTSISLWVVIFLSKFIESYAFLTLPLKEPIIELSYMRTKSCLFVSVPALVCCYHPMIILILVLALALVLFFLDTYLWYVIWSTVLSAVKSFFLGSSIWTPWKNIYSRLPNRMYSKLLASMNDLGIDQLSKISKIWNAIIISMYREHYLSIEQVQKLLYQTAYSKTDTPVIKEPKFFISQEDDMFKSATVNDIPEAQRRISFFAQSLTFPMPEARSVQSMPNFTVFIPHYSEKIILLLKEVIEEDDKYSSVTLLEYLKKLYPGEWMNFVKDTKLMAEEYEEKSGDSDVVKGHINEGVPYFLIGYKEATPVYVMRTRIWASLRSQTLYRTVFGFMNYSKAIKLFYELEARQSSSLEEWSSSQLKEIERLTFRKFHIVVSMQRYKSLDAEELENTEALLRAYPQLQIAYIDEVYDETTEQIMFYSCIIDGNCPKNDKNERVPKYKIRLSGDPLLGDGKSDNQNHSVIFTRGEYIQLIDANQDNYIEECYKIRSVLAEFEELLLSDPYSFDSEKGFNSNPVAIVGSREYIFSENTGILGDVAASKEQSFGTLFARTLALVGGKLHYGHPDFLNSIFMNTRGGVSKSQRGLHLNEDIYAGMNAVIRGGRIKHCEYMQCGKGRDLGFISILNFITKIGAGMGEQTLSREYFYLGTQLPLDRMLSFYYAHVGFHLNNYFIILSIELFLLVGVNLAALTSESVICEYHPFQPRTDPRIPIDCLNLIPVISWLKHCILSIFMVFFLSLLPLFIHELSERGVVKAVVRVIKHMVSISPLFEVFVCKMYSYSLLSDLSVGGAHYIATGRGFATRREGFADLYTRFSNQSLSFGASRLILVLYISLVLWFPPFVFFWVVIAGVLISPFFFNPNQYRLGKYLIDYSGFYKWLHSGNAAPYSKSWINHTQIGRSRFTGAKRKLHYGNQEVSNTNIVRPSRFNIISVEVTPLILISLALWAAFVSANLGIDFENFQDNASLSSSRILIVAILPLTFNTVCLLGFFLISCTLGPLIGIFYKGFPNILAAIAHYLSFSAHVVSALLLCRLQNYDFPQTVLGFTLCCMLQNIIFKVVYAVLLSREVMDGRPNRAWWSGKWIKAGLGWRVLTQPIRELLCKIGEMSYFAADFMIGNLIFYVQMPLLLIPMANTWHSLLLMWLLPKTQARERKLSQKDKRKQYTVVAYSVALLLVFTMVFSAIICVPILCLKYQWFDLDSLIPSAILHYTQPKRFITEDRGLKKSLYRNA